MTTTYTFKICDGVTGVPSAFAAQFSGASCSFEMSEVGSVSFDYLKTGVNYSALDAATSGPVELALFQDGVEMDDGRFRIRSSDDDELDIDSTTKFVGVSLLDMLKGAIVYSADGSLTLGVDQVFTGTAGAILKTLFDQNAARGTNRVMDRITYASFSATLDSNGNAWAFTLSGITYTVGVSYLDVLRNMFNNGMIEFKMVGRDLRVYNAGTMGVDRTVTSEPVVLRKGRDLAEAPRTRTNEQIAAVVLTKGDGNVLKQVVDASVGAAWGFDEAFLSQGGISDDTTLGILTASEIERRKQVRIQNTHKVALNASPYKPGLDYKTSDYIFTDRGTGPTRLRVRQLVIDIDPGGVTYASLVLNDKFLENEIAVSRRVDGILGGASAGGTVAIPVGPEPGEDTTTPMAPASLASLSNVYVDTNGKSLAAVALSWPASTQNTDTTVLSDLDHYETEYKIDSVTNIVAPSAFGPARDEEYYTNLFDRRWKPYGWIAGDGGASERATSGKDIWLFADSYIGTAFGSGKMGTGVNSFIHNSIVVTDPLVPQTFDSRFGMGNRLSANDAFLETTVGLWQADTNCTVARDTAAFWYGTASLKITATAAADATARIAAPTTSNYAVTAGKTYSVMAKVKTLSGTARNVQIGIRWYNAANALLSTSISASSAGLTTGWVRYNLADVAPVGATKAAMIITIKSAAAAQVFNCDTMGLMENDQKMASWNDPNRGSTGPTALIHPEDLGGAAIASGSLANAMFWVDDLIEVGGKLLGFMTRFTPVGAFQNSTAIAQWDGTTHAFEGVFAWSSSDVVQWGSAMVSSGGFLYIYGLDTTDAPATQDTFLMRVPIGNVLGGTKEYLLNVGAGTFTTTRASAIPMYTGFSNHFGNVDFRGGAWNSIITVYGEGTLRRLTASQLWGPWTDTGVIYTQPNMGSGLVAYFPRRHSQFDDNSGVLMSYSVNGTVGGQGPTADVRFYAPKFARGPVSVQAAITPVTAWSGPRIIESGVLTDNIGGIPAGWNFMARVRAVDSSGHYSAWRDGTPIRTVDDTTPPNKPSAPILSPQFKGIRVEWDGFDYQGGPPPSDWALMEVHISTVAEFQPGPTTLWDTFSTILGGVSPIQGLEYGQTYYARFVAIDVRGNRSTPSDAGSVQPEQLVNTAEIAEKLITGAKIADDSIAVRSITVAAFDPSIVPNGTFEDEATDSAGVGLGLPSRWSSTVWTIGGGATVAYETTSPLAGNKSVKMTMATAADGLRYASAKFPVTEGRLLAASVKVKASRAIANPAFEIHIVCGNTEANTGAFPSAGVSVWGTSATITGTTSVQKLELQRIVDSGMKWAQVFITCLNANDGGGGWIGTFDEVNVLPVGGSAYIADASILNAKIANLAVDNAKIANVSVGKLTAGILAADMTVSARIKTSDTGARVELNSSGLQAYNSAGALTVDIAASSGAATFTGQFKTDFATSTTPHIEMRNSGDRTTIYFTDNSGAGTNYAFMNTPLDAGNVPMVGINTGLFTCLGVVNSRQRLFMSTTGGIQLETTGSTGKLGYCLDMNDTSMFLQRTSSAGNLTGGAFVASDVAFWVRRYGGGILNGGQIASDTSNLFLQAVASGVTNAQILLQDNGLWDTMGKLTNNTAFANATTDLIIAGSTAAGDAGGTSHAIAYGSTAVNRPGVCYSMFTTTTTSHRISTFSTTGFTVATSVAAVVGMQYWCWRT